MGRFKIGGLFISLLVILATVAAAGASLELPEHHYAAQEPSADVARTTTDEAASENGRRTTAAPAPSATPPNVKPTPTTAPLSSRSATVELTATAPVAITLEPLASATPIGVTRTVKAPALAATTQVSVTPTLTAKDPPPEGLAIGQSVQGRPIVAHRVGTGPLKLVLVGAIHGAFEGNTQILVQQLLAHFQDHPDQVPGNISLWFVPSMNPDGLATGHRWNANDVDLNRNADTDLDGCAGNDWAPDTVGHEGVHPGAGGAYPFSEPESRAVRDFLDDASIVIFYHSAAAAVFQDTCQRHLPTARLAEALSEGTGYPVPPDGWTGYRITGDFADYLAGEGVASVTVELTDHQDPEFERNLAGVLSVLSGAEEILQAEAVTASAANDGRFIWLNESNTGQWQYPPGTFVHPIALEVLNEVAYLLDGGQVLALDLDQEAPPRRLLAPGDDVAGVRVLEPLALGSNGTSLLVLDRAGDIYAYDPAANQWTVERYDRPPGDTYDHYYVALATTLGVPAEPHPYYLLETSHEQVWRFLPGETGQPAAKLDQRRDIDLAAHGGQLYVLTRVLNTPVAKLSLYRDGQEDPGFKPGIGLIHPRQVRASDQGILVLDRAGRRVLTLEPSTGSLVSLSQFTDRRPVDSLWAEPDGERLILAGRDTLYFYGEPQRRATIESDQSAAGPQAHDVALLNSLRGLQVPLKGAAITSRDFQMPGAPRHYRLGVHEGIDFYEHTVGVPVNRSTPVQAVADGIVIRAMLDYQPLTATQADAWVAQSNSLGYTPAEVLDGYRGRQIWIDHGSGLVSRYAHLGSIAPGIVEGASVTMGQVIATVGNSGTPASVYSETDDVHLHLELWLGDHYIGQFLRPIEAREWLERILR